MPTRIIREGILTSERIDKLSERAELFYRRLMSVADDYGRYFAGIAHLRVNCYPLRPESVSESDVKQFLSECIAANLVVIYGSGKYLQMLDFRQQTRSRSKFPEPTANELLIKCKSTDEQPLSTVGVVGEGGVVGESNNKRAQEPPPEPPKRTTFEIYEAILGRVIRLYNRPENSTLIYQESAALAEICRRENAESELGELESFKARDPGYFPKSLDSLLRKWTATLDRARNYETSQPTNFKPNPRNEGIALSAAAQSSRTVETLKRRAAERQQQIGATHE